ncbi:LYR motif-containing protein 2 isoform X1 [Festucalex cinctus]
MATSRIPASALSLKQFLQRQNVLGIYRNMLRTIRHVPDETDRKYLIDWAREEFKRNRNATNQDAIRMMITQANNHLEELQRSLALAGNSTQKTTKDSFCTS